MNTKKTEKTITLLPGVSFTCTDKDIPLGKIKNIKTGNKHMMLLYPPAPCFVQEVGNDYLLLNIDDQRLDTLIQEYDNQTKLNCYIVTDEVAEKVRFYANDLLPQLTSSRPIKDFFTSLMVDVKKQDLIVSSIAKLAKSDSQLKFNLSDFVKFLGKNSPSLETFNRWKNEKKESPLINGSTQSTNEISPPEELINQDPTLDKQRLEGSDTTFTISLKEAYENQNTVELEKYEKIWQAHSSKNSILTVITELRKISEESIERFFDAFHKTQPGTDAFNELVKTVEGFIDEKNNKS